MEYVGVENVTDWNSKWYAYDVSTGNWSGVCGFVCELINSGTQLQCMYCIAVWNSIRFSLCILIWNNECWMVNEGKMKSNKASGKKVKLQQKARPAILSSLQPLKSYSVENITFEIQIKRMFSIFKGVETEEKTQIFTNKRRMECEMCGLLRVFEKGETFFVWWIHSILMPYFMVYTLESHYSICCCEAWKALYNCWCHWL